MKHEKIETPDIQLTKLLIARSLKDRGIDIDARKIGVMVRDPDSSIPMLRFTYPLRKLKIGIESRWARPENVDADLVTQTAEDHVADFERISHECLDLEADLEEAKKIAKREIARGRRLNFHWSYLGARPSVIEAGDGWTPVPEIFVEMLDATLKLDRFSLVEEDPTDIANELLSDKVRYDQALRSVRHDLVKSVGAGGAIDAVVLAALEQGGCDITDVIRRMRDDAQGFFHQAGDIGINLWWRNGFLSGAFTVAPGVSYGNHELTVDADVKLGAEGKLAGRNAREIIDTPLLEGMTIESSNERFGKLKVVLKPNYRLYDDATSEVREDVF